MKKIIKLTKDMEVKTKPTRKELGLALVHANKNALTVRKTLRDKLKKK